MAAKNQQTGGFAELKQALREKNPANLYLFFGEETYLLHYYLDMLEKKLLSGPAEEFNFHRLTAENFSMEALRNSVEALPMMAERSYIRVDDVDIFRFGEQEREQLAAILEDIPEYCCLVFVFETVEYKPDRRQKRLWSAIEKNAQAVEFQKQSQRDLTPWIIRHFAALDKRISPDLCAYLIEITGGAMAALAGEIDKIAAFALGPEITKYDIDSVTEPVLDAVVFQMTDAIGAGDYAAALKKLRDLYKMQQEPIVILGAVGANLRRISAARILKDHGRGADDLVKLCGMKDYPARKTMSLVNRFSAEFCRQAAELVLEADSQMKTSYDDPQRLLELMILRMAQEQRHD